MFIYLYVYSTLLLVSAVHISYY